MNKTGKQRTAGFTLVEIIVAIAIMGLVSAPICASLVLAGRINARSRAVMEAQLNVRNAVETLMEKGYSEENAAALEAKYQVKIEGTSQGQYYEVDVCDEVSEGETPLVTVETYIRAVEAPAPEGGGG